MTVKEFIELINKPEYLDKKIVFYSAVDSYVYQRNTYVEQVYENDKSEVCVDVG